MDKVPDTVQEEVIKTHPKKRNAKRQNGCLESLPIAEKKKREVKGKGEKQRYFDLIAEFQRKAKRYK